MMYFVDRSAVILKPTQVFLDWLNNALARDEDNIALTLAQIQMNCRVFLVPQQASPEAIISYLDERYLELFEVELSSWFDAKEFWPKDMSLKSFWEFFEVEIQDEVIDLEEGDLINQPLDEIDSPQL